MKMEGDHPDTVPGFMMQSQNFVLKFITGLQKGVVSKLLEMDTDWSVHGDSQADAGVYVDGDGGKVVDGGDGHHGALEGGRQQAPGDGDE